MLLPALLDLYYGQPDWRVFVLSAFFIGGLSLAIALATRGGQPSYSKRFGFLVVNLLWLTLSLVGAIPFYVSSLDMNFADSVFESVSAVTTTGSTVIVGLDHTAPGILLWRSLLQWIGGIGIVALGLFVLPTLRVGGSSFFKMESSDIAERPFARFVSFTRWLIAIYVAITVLCTLGYSFTGMSQLDAINHAMATVATGGFSTHDTSFGYFHSPALLWVSTFFMAVSGLPFSILIVFAVRGRLDTLKDPQIVFFILYLCLFSLAVAIYHRLANGVDFGTAVTHSFFNMTSILTTTGFVSQDYTLWGPFVVAAAFFATFMGACSGSTAGGIKSYRFVIILSTVRTGLKRLVYPHAADSVRYGKRIVDTETQRGVFLFFSSYIVFWALGTLAMTAMGYDLITSASAAITAFSNVGPGLGPIVGPAGTFAPLSDAAKWLLSFLMLLGRLEILTMLVVMTPFFWRD